MSMRQHGFNMCVELLFFSFLPKRPSFVAHVSRVRVLKIRKMMMSLMPPKLPTLGQPIIKPSWSQVVFCRPSVRFWGRQTPTLVLSCFFLAGLLLMNAHIKLHLSYLRVSVVTVLQLMDFQLF